MEGRVTSFVTKKDLNSILTKRKGMFKNQIARMKIILVAFEPYILR